MANAQLSRRRYLISIALVAINMRLPITAMPPLMQRLTQQLGLSASSLGWLTTIPLLVFAGLSPLIAKLGMRHGYERVISWFTVVLLIGTGLRCVSQPLALFVGTGLIALGIAAANVLLPASIKTQLPTKPQIGIVSYTTTMGFAGAIGTAFAGVVAGTGRLSWLFAALALLAAVSVIGWWPARQLSVSQSITTGKPTSDVKRTKVGWAVMGYFGLQAMLYYSLVTWLPSMLTASGQSVAHASLMATILQLTLLPFGLLTPILAVKRHGAKWLNLVMAVSFVAGIAILLLWPGQLAGAVTASLLLGTSCGISFNLAVVFFALKTKTPESTAALSGFAQSAGYLLAAVGPLGFGQLATFLTNWQAVMVLMLILALVMGAIGEWVRRAPRLP